MGFLSLSGMQELQPLFLINQMIYTTLKTCGSSHYSISSTLKKMFISTFFLGTSARLK